MGFGKKILKAIVIAVIFGIVAGAFFAGSNFICKKILPEEKQPEIVALPDLGPIPEERFNPDEKEDEPEVTEPSEEETVESTQTITEIITIDVSDVVEEVMPSIVSITTISVSEYYMWGRTYQYENEGAGSGIIVGQDADYLYILTNRHVVSGADTLTVTFNDDTAADASIKGLADSLDIAVCTVRNADLSATTLHSIRVAQLGDSDVLKPGQGCIAIGNALGYGQSVTTGVISALDREVTSGDSYTGATFSCDAIQTDAAINPGNSGGALLDFSGRVIGINSSKLSSTNVEGMGFAIPINSAAPMITELISRVEIPEERRGYLGIYGREVDASTAAFMGVPTGIAIYQIQEGSPAELAGIQVGDIVTAFNGVEVRTMQDLQNQMAYIEAGTVVKITLAAKDEGYQPAVVEATLTNKP